MPKNTFNYIWMGRLPKGGNIANFKDGPNALAEKLKQYNQEQTGFWNSIKTYLTGAPEINMWVPRALIDGIKEAGYLDPLIKLRPVEDLINSSAYFSPEELALLQTTVNLLGDHNAYASQKDILSAFLMEEKGGYFLDTTTEIKSIELLLKRQPKTIWFPRISEEESKYYDGNLVATPEVWAFFNPVEGGGTFKGMVKSYIERCQYYFPEYFNDIPKGALNYKIGDELRTGFNIFDGEASDVQNPDNQTLLEDGAFSYGKGSVIMAKEDRDHLIGATAIFSFLDGLNSTQSLSKITALSSLAEEGSDSYSISSMGIVKHYRGSWRSQSLAEQAQVKDSNTDMPKQSSYQKALGLLSTDSPVSTTSAKVEEGLPEEQKAVEKDTKQLVLEQFEARINAADSQEELSTVEKEIKNSDAYKKLPPDSDIDKTIEAMIDERAQSFSKSTIASRC